MTEEPTLRGFVAHVQAKPQQIAKGYSEQKYLEAMDRVAKWQN